jgi:hypothetical protein
MPDLRSHHRGTALRTSFPGQGQGLRPRLTLGLRLGLGLTLGLGVAGCQMASVSDEGGEPGAAVAAASGPTSGSLSAEQEAFWARLEAHCGEAYPGTLADATPYYRPGVEGRGATIHFFSCEPERIHVPFHLDDNRSRNWILTRADGVLRLKHDHRHEDGEEEEISQYGGDAYGVGLATRQIFYADAFTGNLLPDRADNFWFLDFVDDETLEYGVHWPRLGHSVRFTFDLSQPVALPPAPWGYESP